MQTVVVYELFALGAFAAAGGTEYDNIHAFYLQKLKHIPIGADMANAPATLEIVYFSGVMPTRCGIRSVSRFLEHVDVGEIACQTVKVETEPDDELGRNRETDIVGFDIALQRLGLEQQGGDFEYRQSFTMWLKNAIFA